MDLIEVECEDVDWMHLDQDREGPMAGCCEHSNEPWGSIKGGERLD
jgi:hypothetical protein